MDDVIRDIVIGCRIMDTEGLTNAVGHLSARVPGTTDRFYIPPRQGPGLTQDDQVLTMDLDGSVVAGTGTPNTEWPMHAEVYRARPDVVSICHTHSFYAIVLAAAGQTVRPVHNWGAIFGPEVPVYMDPEYIRRPEQGRALAAALGQSRALLLRGHGAIITGSSAREAVISAIRLEYNAHIQYCCMQIGTPLYYTPGETERITYSPPRSWQYYAHRVELAYQSRPAFQDGPPRT